VQAKLARECFSLKREGKLATKNAENAERSHGRTDFGGGLFQSLFEKPAMGSTGHRPVPPGYQPGGRVRAAQFKQA